MALPQWRWCGAGENPPTLGHLGLSAESAGEVAGVAGGKTHAEEAETPDAPWTT